MSVFRTVFDDGSVLLTDENANVVGAIPSPDVTSAPGASSGVGDAITRQFADLFNYGVRAVINRNTQPAQPYQTSAPARLGAQGGIGQLAILGLIGFALFKFLK